MERDIIAGAFSSRVGTGSYGWGNQIKVSSITDALASISKTIELAGQPIQLYRSDQKYQLFIERVVEGFRRAEPPTIPQLAVPVTVPHEGYRKNTPRGRTSIHPLPRPKIFLSDTINTSL